MKNNLLQTKSQIQKNLKDKLWLQALQESEKYLEIEKDDLEVRILLTQSYLGLNDLENAKKEIEFILAKNDTLPDALNLNAIITMQTGEAEEAIVILKKALESHPNFWKFHYNLAELYFSQRKFKEASHEYIAAINYKNSIDIFERLLIIFQINSSLFTLLSIILILVFIPFISPFWVATTVATICFLFFGLTSRINYRIGNKKLGLLSLVLGVVILFLHVISILGYSLMDIIHIMTN